MNKDKSIAMNTIADMSNKVTKKTLKLSDTIFKNAKRMLNRSEEQIHIFGKAFD